MRMMWLYVGVLLGGMAAAQVPIDQEPRHHLEFSNEALRVISPQIPPGDTTLEHVHTRDEATICIHGSSVRGKPHDGEWSKPGMACEPGRAGLTEYTGNSRSHTVQNMGKDVYYLVLVENLRENGWTTHEALNATGLKVLRENRAFRVYDTDLSGAEFLEHTHEVPTVVVLVSGEAMAGDKLLDRPGRWALAPAGAKHRIAAQGSARVVEIEVR